MSLLTRTLVPRSVRRAAHPARTVRRAATPRAVKEAQRLAHPVDNAVYGATRKLNTKSKKGAQIQPPPGSKHPAAYMHGAIAGRFLFLLLLAVLFLASGAILPGLVLLIGGVGGWIWVYKS
jgi:Flp pilus assembly protein TadB